MWGRQAQAEGYPDKIVWKTIIRQSGTVHSAGAGVQAMDDWLKLFEIWWSSLENDTDPSPSLPRSNVDNNSSGWREKSGCPTLWIRVQGLFDLELDGLDAYTQTPDAALAFNYSETRPSYICNLECSSIPPVTGGRATGHGVRYTPSMSLCGSLRPRRTFFELKDLCRSESYIKFIAFRVKGRCFTEFLNWRIYIGPNHTYINFIAFPV